jgi:hypothetical protein
MHLVGNRVTMQKLWDIGARKHKMLHGFGGSGSFSPIRQTWSNYVWDGTRYVLEHFGPDDEDKYPLPNPAKDYSIDDLLLQWQSVGYPAGIHQFQAEFFDDDGNEVPAPAQILTLMVDNNWPEVDIVDVLHNNASVPACSLEYMVDNADGLKFKITANDPAGHLSHYVLDARHGDGRNVPLVSDDYSNHRDPSHRWQGVTDELVPPSEWVPPRTCAYEFRLRAYPRVTNGYNGKQHYCGYVEDTRHVTLIKPEVPRAITPRISADLPLGLLSTDRLDVEGEEPDKLGEETLELLEGN